LLRRSPRGAPGNDVGTCAKLLSFIGKGGEKIRRFQFTAIDDATRVRALKIYDRHTQANVIDLVDHVIGTFSFRIKEIRTDNGHEF
jgi:hypothetical protein